MDTGAPLPEAEMNIINFNDRLNHSGFPARPGRTAGQLTTYGVSRNFVQRKAAAITRVFTLVFMLMVPVFMLTAPSQASAATRLLALGDSLTAGYMLPGDALFPVVLQRRLREAGHDVEVINAGVSGDTSSGGLERLDWAIGDGVDAAIVELGANDMLRGLQPAATEKTLDEIMQRLSAKGIPVLIAGMLAAPGMGKDFETSFNGIYPKLAKKYDAILYPFFLDGVAGNPALQLSDGMHPTKAGVEIIVERILPSVIALLQRVPKK
ncbi:MAG: lipolytic protein [Hyphomicrobiales bacterium]|nr:lipolytic protein [Hyphomicrobiales bacterium]